MENENGSPQNVTPVFGGESPDYSGMDEGQAQTAYRELMTDRVSGKNLWSGDKFSETVSMLYRKGFSRQVEEKESERAQESEKWLSEENDRIEQREDNRALGEAKKEAARYFGGEERAERVIEQAKGVLKSVASQEDYNFLSEGPGNNPRVIEVIANLHGHRELYPIVRKIGVANLLKVGEIALKRRER